MKQKRPSYVKSDVSGYWLPPKRWKMRLYRFFGRTAPDRFIRFTD